MPPKTTMKPAQILAHLELHGVVKSRLHPRQSPKPDLPKVLTIATVSFTRRELELHPETRERVEKVEKFCETLAVLANEKSGYKFSKREFFLNAVVEAIDRINNQGESEEANNG